MIFFSITIRSGQKGEKGLEGLPGLNGLIGPKGRQGDPGLNGMPGMYLKSVFFLQLVAYKDKETNPIFFFLVEN